MLLSKHRFISFNFTLGHKLNLRDQKHQVHEIKGLTMQGICFKLPSFTFFKLLKYWNIGTADLHQYRMTHNLSKFLDLIIGS
jgi:hypothetical protein